jgi:tRNA A37 threonylcarbamoyladenosine modification protein TsaB
MARLLPLGDRILVPVINARRGQVYGALFRYWEGELDRITSDMVLDMERWRALEQRVLFLGPGVDDLEVDGIKRLPSAALGAALLAMDRMARGESGEDPESLMPLYLRPSDAEVHLGIKVSSWD